MMLDHAGIEKLVPHAGAMCLLGSVLNWDATHIVCASPATGPGHPLARNGVVPVVAATEYAAQATAVHGALVDGVTTPRAGMLAKLIDVALRGADFPEEGGTVSVRAEMLGRSAAGCLYAFEVACDSQPLASGKLLVAFTPTEAA